MRRGTRVRAWAAIVAASLLATAAGPAHAQTIALPRNALGGDVGADVSNVTLDEYAPSHLATFAATLWGAGERSAGAIEASANRFESGHLLYYGAAHAALDLERDASWHSTVQGDLGGGAYRGQAATGYGQLSIVTEHVASDATRTWIGGAIGHAGGSFQYGTAHATAGVALTRAGATLSGAAKVAYAHTTYADLTSRLSWRTPLRLADAPISVTMDAGVREGRHDPHQRWSSIGLIVPLISGAKLEASYGVLPSDPELAMIGARTATVGLHIGFAAHRPDDALTTAPAPLGPDVRVGTARPGTDRRVLVVRIPAASTVEIMGDFTAWMPVTLQRTSAVEWRGEFALPDGAHRANIRVDGGAWVALPGTPQVDDDFGGRSSLLVVR